MRVDASVVQVVGWRCRRHDGRLGVFRGSAVPPGCRLGGAWRRPAL